MITFTNTLGGKKETFESIQKNKVGMYNCGPTVYDYAHIGNLRSYIFADILRRTLEFNGYSVNQVVNITDIGHLSSDSDEGEDKMTKGLKREGKPLTLEAMRELASFYTERFIEDLKDLNIELPTHLPKASEHIEEDIELIKKLESKGFTYTTSDGVYFDTSKDVDYGKLGKVELSSNEEHSRIGINQEKKNPKDFAVWKFNDKLGFQSPWGKGFPGWHIECSVMSMKYLGETFDIHTGGVDHIPVHHNNEIAQSESATDKAYAHFWLHNAFLIIEGGKMAKSDGNFIRLQTIKDKNLNPLSYRYWLLGARYNTPMNFSWEALEGAQNAYKKIITHVEELGTELGTPDEKYLTKFKECINNDLDTPNAVALLWDLIQDSKLDPKTKRATILEFDKVLGLGLAKQQKLPVPEEIKQIITAREEARKNKDWKKSDELRSQIEQKGYRVKDTDQGPQISKI